MLIGVASTAAYVLLYLLLRSIVAAQAANAISLLLATAVLYLAGLGRSGYANEFYAAAVQAGTKSWKAFLFGSLDSSDFITWTRHQRCCG